MQNIEKLRALLEPSVESLGYELLHIEFAGSGGNILRLYIDAPGGIEIDDCESVSRQVSLILDVEDPVKNAYTLEVSSPGLDRPLVKPEHFQKFSGELAKIVMHTHVLGRRRFTGKLIEADDTQVVLEADGESYELPYEQMESARLEPVFESRR
ncbi:MAG: ribosome maturation factor RimP [Gammaproteobacteria bacterium]|jgi:ribosome maturation factor RimP